MSSAAFLVPATSASIGDRPPSTMSLNSRAFWPCGYTPASVPRAMRMPAFTARANVARMTGAAWRALVTAHSGNRPLSACSRIVSPARRVGTRKQFFSFMRRMPSSSMKVPCSIEATPARIAALMPSAPWAWLHTRRPRCVASSTMRCNSSSENWRASSASPAESTPPEDMILITPAPCLIA